MGNMEEFKKQGYLTELEQSPFPKSLTEEEVKKLFENRLLTKAKTLAELDEGEFYPIPNLVGAYRAIFIDENNMGAEEVTFGITRFDPGSFHVKHAHADCEEIMYFMSGKVVGGVGDVEYIQQAGDVIFVPRNAPHWAYNPFDEPAYNLFLYTRPSLKKAGYSLDKDGYHDVSAEVENIQNQSRATEK